MSIGRRKVSLDDPNAWVFNRMVDAYEARPAYPVDLVEALQGYIPRGGRALDVGAGLGHLALPLAQAGAEVVALEPAANMLERLARRAHSAHVPLQTVRGQAEELPFLDQSFELVILADALHFIDSERAAREIARVLAPNGSLAVLVCEFAPTPFMSSLKILMEEAAPRRPRNTAQSLTELFAVSGLALPEPQLWTQEVPVDEGTLFGILGSISFIGPAMNPERAAAFRAKVRAIPHPPQWARSLQLHVATRRGRTSSP